MKRDFSSNPTGRIFSDCILVLDGIPVPERVKIAKTSNDYL